MSIAVATLEVDYLVCVPKKFTRLKNYENSMIKLITKFLFDLFFNDLNFFKDDGIQWSKNYALKNLL